MTKPLFLENNTRYRIQYTHNNKHVVEMDCWRLNDKFINDNCLLFDDNKVEVLERLGIDSEVFD